MARSLTFQVTGGQTTTVYRIPDHRWWQIAAAVPAGATLAVQVKQGNFTVPFLVLTPTNTSSGPNVGLEVENTELLLSSNQSFQVVILLS